MHIVSVSVLTRISLSPLIALNYINHSLPCPCFPGLIFICLFLLFSLFISLSVNFSSHYSNSACLLIILPPSPHSLSFFLFSLSVFPLISRLLLFLPLLFFSLFFVVLYPSLPILLCLLLFFFLPISEQLG